MFAFVTAPATVPSPSWLDSLPALRSKPEAGQPPRATLASVGAPTDGDGEPLPSLDHHLIRDPEATFFLRARGDDWAETGIHDGDLLVVDQAAPGTTGSLVVMAAADGIWCLARLDRDADGRRVAWLANPDRSVPLLEDGSSPVIQGVVRWAIHRLWPGRFSA